MISLYELKKYNGRTRILPLPLEDQGKDIPSPEKRMQNFLYDLEEKIIWANWSGYSTASIDVTYPSPVSANFVKEATEIIESYGYSVLRANRANEDNGDVHIEMVVCIESMLLSEKKYGACEVSSILKKFGKDVTKHSKVFWRFRPYQVEDICNRLANKFEAGINIEEIFKEES